MSFKAYQAYTSNPGSSPTDQVQAGMRNSGNIGVQQNPENQKHDFNVNTLDDFAKQFNVNQFDSLNQQNGAPSIQMMQDQFQLPNGVNQDPMQNQNQQAAQQVANYNQQQNLQNLNNQNTNQQSTGSDIQDLMAFVGK